MISADVAERLAAAKLWLVSQSAGDLPYLSTAVYSLVTVATERVSRMSTDAYWRLYVNPMWVLATDVEVLAREIAHQVWHLLADHADRAIDCQVDTKSRDRWTAAMGVCVGAAKHSSLDTAVPVVRALLRPGRRPAGAELPAGLTVFVPALQLAGLL